MSGDLIGFFYSACRYVAVASVHYGTVCYYSGHAQRLQVDWQKMCEEMTPGVNMAVPRKEVINMRHLNETRELLPLVY